MSTQPASVIENLQRKLHPSRFPRLSGTMAAIIGFLVDAAYADPHIEEMAVTSDGFVLARAQGEVVSRFIGAYSDLLRNYFDLQDAAKLTSNERMAMDEAFASKIGFHGPTAA